MNIKVLHIISWAITNFGKAAFVPKSLEIKNFQEIITYNTICLNACLCGVINHPVQVFRNEKRSFQTYPTGVEAEPDLERWISKSFSTVSFTYPMHIVICLQTSMINMPEPKSFYVHTNNFISNLNFLKMTQGNINHVYSSDIEEFKESLQYIDLSRNEITFIESESFINCKQLQEIDLRFNKVHNLGELGASLITNGWTRPTLRIRGNPLQCTCALLESITHYVTLLYEDQPRCVVGENVTTQSETEDFKETPSKVKPSWRFDIAQSHVVNRLTSLMCSHKHESAEARNSIKTEADHIDLTGDGLKGLLEENMHQLVDTSEPHDGSEKHHNHDEIRIYQRSSKLDIPMLITMGAWVIMLYVGINKFINMNKP